SAARTGSARTCSRSFGWSSRARPIRPMILGVILGHVAQDLTRPGEVAVAPAVVRGDEQDVVAQARRGVDRELDAAGGVALAAPHRELARALRPVLGAAVADAEADHGQPVDVGVQTPQRLAPQLAAAVEAARPPEGRRGHALPRPAAELVVPSLDQRAVRHLALPG